MEIKTVEVDGTTYGVLQDGKPVFMDAGKEIALDVPQMHAKIGQLNGEAKTHREAKEAAEAKLKAFDGIEDPEAAQKALQTLKSLDDKKLIDAGEVERVKAEAIKAVEEKYKPTVEKAEQLEQQLRQEKIGGSFARSEFIKSKMAREPFEVEALLGKNFAVEEGKIIAKDANGNMIYSPSHPGEPASFDEALESLVSSLPNKDKMLLGAGQTGSGAKPAAGSAGAKTMTRGEFEKLAPADAAAKMADGFTLTD